MQRENEAGQRMRAAAIMGTQFCALHGNPERAAELGRMGGQKNRHYIETEPVNITQPSTAEDVKNVIGQAIVDVRARKLDPRIAMALTSTSRVLLEAFQRTSRSGWNVWSNGRAVS
jgi:hypothetical protein